MHVKKTRRKLVAVALMLIACLGISGMFAYLMDTDAEKNEFAVGRVSLDLQEPEWNPENATELVPGDEVEKDPRILNDGISNEYVYLTVDVPYKTITTADDAGSIIGEKDVQLFEYTVNDGWELIGTPSWENGFVTYTYAYASNGKLTILHVGDTTPALFGSATFVNAVEDNGLEATVQDIVINAYGIQVAGFDNERYSPEDLWIVLREALAGNI